MKRILKTISLGLMLSACGPTGMEKLAAQSAPYAPTEQPNKSVEALRQELESELKQASRFQRLKPYKGFSIITYDEVRGVQIGTDSAFIQFGHAIVPADSKGDATKIHTYRFDFEQLAGLPYNERSCQLNWVTLPDGMYVTLQEPIGRPLCDTLYNLGLRAKERQDWAEAEFTQQVAAYARQSVKPPIPEDIRRLIVQAELLRERKDYDGAAERYRKVVDLAPVVYPAAYFNLALLYEQQERYPQAINAMKKYLLLQPAAQDARAAQDKIYGWEMLAGEK